MGKRSENKQLYFGNRFNAIPLKVDCGDNIIIEDLYVVQAPEGLRNAINIIIDEQSSGIFKYDKNQYFSPYIFSQGLQNLYYPIIASQNNFYSNDGEWIYLAEDYNVELLKYHFRNWCSDHLDRKHYEYIKSHIEGIEIVKKDIIIPANPHQLNTKKLKFYLYTLYPQYLTYILNGNLNVQVDSINNMGVSIHDFYKLQNKDQVSEMISLPFKKMGLWNWTYSLDIFVRTIEGLNYPLLFLNMRTNRFFDYIPSVRKGKGINAVVYKKVNKGFEAFKLPLYSKKEKDKEREWFWRYDLSVGFKSKSLEDLNATPEEFFGKGKRNKKSEVIKYAGIIHGSHIYDDHKVTPRSSDYDEQPVFNKVLVELRERDKKTNLMYGDFIELENIFERLGSVPEKDNQLRFEQLPETLIIDAYYTNDDWLLYLLDAIYELFNPKSTIFETNNAQNFGKACITRDIKNYEFTIQYKIKKQNNYIERKISINPIKIDSSIRDKFLFNCKKNEVASFKEFISQYIKPVGIDRVALFELEYKIVTTKGTIDYFKDKVDPKSIIRNMLAKNNRISQFISYQTTPYIQVAGNDKKQLTKYKAELMKYLNGVKDIFRQMGIIGKSLAKGFEGDKVIFIGLYFMSKLKYSFDYTETDKITPNKLTLPILVAIVNDEVKMALFSEEAYSKHRRTGKNFSVEWLPYQKALLRISESASIFNELNDDYAAMMKSQFIDNALNSIYSFNQDKKIILFANVQNARQYITELTNADISNGDIEINLDIDKERRYFWNNTVIIRLVTDERNETPGWIHIKKDGEPIYDTLRQGAFKLAENVYYLVNPKGDNHKPNRDVKEFESNNTGLRMSALEVSVRNVPPGDVEKYIYLTEVLRSRSMPINFSNAIKLPLPLHLAYSAVEYITAYYDEWFLMNYLKKHKEDN